MNTLDTIKEVIDLNSLYEDFIKSKPKYGTINSLQSIVGKVDKLAKKNLSKMINGASASVCANESHDYLPLNSINIVNLDCENDKTWSCCIFIEDNKFKIKSLDLPLTMQGEKIRENRMDEHEYEMGGWGYEP